MVQLSETVSMFQWSLVAKAAPLVPGLLHIHKSALHALAVSSCRASTTAAETQPHSQEPGWKMIPIEGAVEITEFLPRMSSKLNNNERVWINALSGSPDTDGWGRSKCSSQGSARPPVWQAEVANRSLGDGNGPCLAVRSCLLWTFCWKDPAHLF